ncbi:ABC transporter ATP-binding protein [Solirubrobacter phytolaccae]|uniref:ABC transporter ATP-binding protein n=1 Tax=Solirubrobacter phytolaccae TaxID=1404360 RepID=A0A9X3N9U4_9ACTN|nr:ABC transporter ATP-binding protein [Solirubrobacter phytolaccae]MDA0180176.1 ABC transporter ATP-binding protein [Solirubrobacter phytolaccae]
MSALLEVEGVHAGYGPVNVLEDISLEVGEGQTVALLGANGAGKTTTLRAISGMLKPRGRIRIAGHDVTGRATERIVKLGVAHVPEGRGTFAPLTVEENLRLGAYARRNGGPDLERAFTLFPRLGERRHQRAGTLSGGEQQMLAIARALMLQPRLMLLDEPSLGLAPNLTRELFKVLRQVKEDEGTAMLVVEQNANLVLEFADAAHVLETGRIVLSGTADEVSADESMRKAYLGY